MPRLTLFSILWSLAIIVGWAQEVTTSKEKSSPAPIAPAAEPIFLPDDSHAIDLILEADARQSDSVKRVVEALEEAGIAKGRPAETALLAASSIFVTLSMRQDESYEKIKQLIEALKNVGVQQISCRGKGVVRAEGEKEQNVLILQTHPGNSTDELHRIQRAARMAAKQCGLSLIMATRGLEVPENEEIFTAPERVSGEKRPLLEDANSPVPHLSGEAEPAREAQASEIRVFALKNSQAVPTAELLMQLITVKPFRAVADAPHNSVVVIGSTEQLQAVEALLLKLDEPPREPIAEPKHDGKSAVGEDASKQIEQQVAQLRVAYETANKLAHELAQSLRKTPDTGKKPELRTAVQRAFTLRQSLLRTELLEMQTRLIQTQQSMDMRERIADQIVDRRVEDLLNPQLDWEQTSNNDPNGQAESEPPKQPESRIVDNSGVVTELEGDWHLVAHISETGTDRRPRNLTIRGDKWTHTTWDGHTMSSSLAVDPKTRTVDFGNLPGEKPILSWRERGTYEVDGDRLTIHSDITFTDSEIGKQKQHETNIWKRGLREIGDYDGRSPENGMAFFFLNGNDENTGQGKLIPGDKVDVLVSFNSLDETPVQRVLVENLEVDRSSEGTAKSKRQVGLLGTEEQCSLLSNVPKHGIMSLRLREADDEVLEDPIVFNLESPGGINWEAFKELDASDPYNSELEGDWYQISATYENGKPLETSATNLYFRKRRYILAYPGGHTERRVEIDPNKKEIRYFENGDDSSMIPDNYLLEGDQLTIFNESRKNVYRRGVAPFPPVSEEQQRR